MDCVITRPRLQMEVGMFFSVPGPEKCKEIGKIGEILFGGRRTEEKLGKMTFKSRQKFYRENVEIFWVVREPRQNLSSGSRVGKG